MGRCRDWLRAFPAATPAGPTWERTDTVVLGTLAALFCVSRWIWVVAFPRSAFYWEEAYRWIVVDELAPAGDWSLGDLQADHYQGGSLAVLLLARALSLLSGPGILTLKLAAIAISCLTLATLYVIGRHFFGRTVGALAAAAYLCGPPLVAFWGVCLMGFHTEATLPALLLVYVTLALMTARWCGPLAWALAGLLATLGVWFTPTTGIAVAACAIAWWLVGGLPPRRATPAIFVGAVVGAIPWLLYNTARDFVGVKRVIEVFSTAESNDVFRTQSVWQRAVELVLRVPAEGLMDPGGVLDESPLEPVVIAGALLPAFAGLVIGVWRLLRPAAAPSTARGDDARLELVFWIYAAVFTVAYLASRFTIDEQTRPIAFRLFVTPVVFLGVPVAVSAARALRTGGAARPVGAAATLLFLVSLATATGLFAVRYEAAGAPPERSLGYVTLGRLVQRKYPEPPARGIAIIEKMPAGEPRAWALQGIGWGITEYFEQGGSLRELRDFAAELGEDDPVLSGMRWGVESRLANLLALRAGGTASRDLDRSIERMKAMQRILARDTEDPDSSDDRSPEDAPQSTGPVRVR